MQPALCFPLFERHLLTSSWTCQRTYMYIHDLSYSCFHIKGSWSIHSFNGDYLYIYIVHTGSWGDLFHEIPGTMPFTFWVPNSLSVSTLRESRIWISCTVPKCEWHSFQNGLSSGKGSYGYLNYPAKCPGQLMVLKCEFSQNYIVKTFTTLNIHIIANKSMWRENGGIIRALPACIILVKVWFGWRRNCHANFFLQTRGGIPGRGIIPNCQDWGWKFYFRERYIDGMGWAFTNH